MADRELRGLPPDGVLPGAGAHRHRGDLGLHRRMLLMAPLHHHFEVGGVKESQVVVRFWIVTMMLVLFGLSTMKLR